MEHVYTTRNREFWEKVKSGDLVLPDVVGTEERKKIGDLADFEKGIAKLADTKQQIDFIDSLLKARFGLTRESAFITQGPRKLGDLPVDDIELFKLAAVYFYLNGYTWGQIFNCSCFADPTNNWFLGRFPDIDINNLFVMSTLTSSIVKDISRHTPKIAVQNYIGSVRDAETQRYKQDLENALKQRGYKKDFLSIFDFNAPNHPKMISDVTGTKKSVYDVKVCIKILHMYFCQKLSDEEIAEKFKRYNIRVHSLKTMRSSVLTSEAKNLLKSIRNPNL